MRDFLTANYHTHTVRCRHACDSEREYIETAIKMGIKWIDIFNSTILRIYNIIRIGNWVGCYGNII